MVGTMKIKNCHKLDSGAEHCFLKQNRCIKSKNGCFFLVMKTDGNVCLYKDNPIEHHNVIWQTNTAGKSGGQKCIFRCQDDGNLVVYNCNSQPIWASNTSTDKSHGPFLLRVQDDGNLVCYDRNNKVIWASNTYQGQPNFPSKQNVMFSGSLLEGGDKISHPSKKFKLIMQNDGNLVLYKDTHPLWASNTCNQGKKPYKFRCQEDGNLVIYDGSPKQNNQKHVLWASNSNNKGEGPFRLIVQDDGNLVLYDKHSKAIWASNTHG